MAYSTVPTVISGDSWTAGNQNTYVRDNFKAGIPDIFNAAGDMAYGTMANVAGVLPIGEARDFLQPSNDLSSVVWDTKPFVGCRVYDAGNDDDPYTYPILTWFNMFWGPESYDTDDIFDSTSGSSDYQRTFTIPYNGIYQISGNLNFNGGTALGQIIGLRLTIDDVAYRTLSYKVYKPQPYINFIYVDRFILGDKLRLQVNTIPNYLTAPLKRGRQHVAVTFLGVTT